MAITGGVQVIQDGVRNTVNRDNLDQVRDKDSINQKVVSGGFFSAQLYAKIPTGGLTSGSALNFYEVDANDDFYLPRGSQIIEALYKVTETFTSATDAATLSIGIPTDDPAGTIAAIAISNVANPWDATTKAVTTIQTGAHANNSELTTDVRPIVLTAGGGETVTNGTVYLWIKYIAAPRNVTT